jgi:hypothetical protein
MSKEEAEQRIAGLGQIESLFGAIECGGVIVKDIDSDIDDRSLRSGNPYCLNWKPFYCDVGAIHPYVARYSTCTVVKLQVIRDDLETERVDCGQWH